MATVIPKITRKTATVTPMKRMVSFQKSDRPSRHQYHTAVLGFLIGNKTVCSLIRSRNTPFPHSSADRFPEKHLLYFSPGIRLFIADNIPSSVRSVYSTSLSRYSFRTSLIFSIVVIRRICPIGSFRGKAFDLPHQIDTVSGIFIFRYLVLKRMKSGCTPTTRRQPDTPFSLAAPILPSVSGIRTYPYFSAWTDQVILPEDQESKSKIWRPN